MKFVLLALFAVVQQVTAQNNTTTGSVFIDPANPCRAAATFDESKQSPAGPYKDDPLPD
jgi:hypothetical protein